jgi:ABC-type lipoprotein export system ATPase subunit
LADEPTASLDDSQAFEVMTVLRDWCESSGGGVLLASHDARTLPFQTAGIDFTKNLTLNSQHDAR